MTSAHHPHHHASAHDALLDQLEHELAWLTSAPLGIPAVDAFSKEFLNHGLPPPRADVERRLPGG